MAAEGTHANQPPDGCRFHVESATCVSCFSPFYAAYLCLIILLAVGKMPEYLQDLDDGSVLLFKLCLENATIISEKHSVK